MARQAPISNSYENDKCKTAQLQKEHQIKPEVRVLIFLLVDDSTNQKSSLMAPPAPPARRQISLQLQAYQPAKTPELAQSDTKVQVVEVDGECRYKR
jgi:hypothetical protein